MNRRLTEPIFRVSESYLNVKIYFLNTCGGGSLEKEEKKIENCRSIVPVRLE